MAVMLLSRLSFKRILIEHIKTFHKYRENKLDWFEVCEYFLLPLFPTLTVVYLFDALSNDITSVLTTFYSIFCGLLFSFIVVLQAEFKKFIETNQIDSQELVKETYSNAAFSIVLSIIALAQLFIYEIIKQRIPNHVSRYLAEILRSFTSQPEHVLASAKNFMLNLFEGLIVYSSIIFLITLLLVIRRLYRICKPSH